MQAICPTHGEVDAKETHYGDGTVVLRCACGLICTPLEAEDSMSLEEIQDALDAISTGGGWYEFDDGTRKRGRAAALEYIMEDE